MIPYSFVLENVENDKTLWRNRSCLQDITQTWISKFVDFAISVPQIKQENLLELCTWEHAENLYGTLKAEQEKLRAASHARQKPYVEKEAVH